MNIELPYKVLSSIDGDVCTIYLYGVIGQDQSWDEKKAKLAITDVEILQTIQEKEAAGCTRCNVRINSPGGSVAHGDGIIAALKNTSMEVHGYVDGVAASMAADIFLSIKKENRHVNSNSKLMIHAPMNGVFGNAKDHREAATMLDTFADAAISQMVEDTGMKEEDVRSMFYDGSNHWFSAKTMMETGFVNQVDTYETEMTVDEPEKMSYADLVKFYAQPTKIEAGVLSRINHYLQSKFGSSLPESIQTDDDMKTVEDIQKAVADGTIDKAALLAALEVEQKAPEAPATPEPKKETPPAPEKSMAELITEAVTAATAPLKAEIEALKAAPGAKPTQTEDAEDPYKGMTEAQKKAMQEYEEANKVFDEAGAYGAFER